ncbi:MAG TPA: NAD(P)/FAD-dependent oxidoreductase [Smithellaceae bacterium]|nr:NAD(P)/FAD-dependent oxidoreductase [Smithellaceae bacterium]
MKIFPNLFSPFRLGTHELKNRIVMSPMATNSCNIDGSVSPANLAYYAKRARGGVGMIIVEFISVDYPVGRGSLTQFQLADSRVIAGFHALVDSIKPYGTKVIAQLHHAGARSIQVPDIKIMGPVDDKSGKIPVHGMTKEDIAYLTNKFVQAALNARQAGFDGVELHSAHGYLLSQFLSLQSNTRTDEYGGDVAGRSRFLVEIIQGIRKACGPQFLISVRLGVRDWDPKGLALADGLEAAKIIDREGIDLINVSTGARYSHFGAVETQEKPDGFRLDLARAVKPLVKTPVAIVGKLRTGAMCDDVVKGGVADLVVIGRPLICDPEWPNKMQSGREAEIRQCLNCLDGCYTSLTINSGIRCAINPYAGFESIYDEGNLPRVIKPKKVVVVGGGIAGMQAALTAAERGHAVTLLEKKPALGGQLQIASIPPHKEVLNTIAKYFAIRMQQEGVTVKLGVDADVATIAALHPDTVILATGSLPVVPPIPGIERAIQSWDILSGARTAPEGRNIVIIGGGTVGCETALYLLGYRNRITILEMLKEVSGDQEGTHRTRDLEILKNGGVDIRTLATVQKITGAGVDYLDKDGKMCQVKADLVIVSTGQRPVGSALAEALADRGILVKMAGDAGDIGKIRTNTLSGFLTGYSA